MRKLFYLLIATLVLVSCGNGSKKKTGENQAEEIQSNRIEVLYFHGAQRCITCRAIETNTVALLDSLYSKEKADGKIIYKVIDISKKENEAIADGKSSVSCPLKPSDSTPLKHSTMPP